MLATALTASLLFAPLRTEPGESPPPLVEMVEVTSSSGRGLAPFVLGVIGSLATDALLLYPLFTLTGQSALAFILITPIHALIKPLIIGLVTWMAGGGQVASLGAIGWAYLGELAVLGLGALFGWQATGLLTLAYLALPPAFTYRAHATSVPAVVPLVKLRF